MSLLVLLWLLAGRTVAGLSLVSSTAGEAAQLAEVASSSHLLKSLVRDLELLRRSIPQFGAKSLVQLEASPAKPRLNPADVLQKMNALGKGHMPEMTVLLKGMYDSWKEKIGEANKHEEGQKLAYEQNLKELEAKKALVKGDKAALATYDKIEQYWKRQRAISHRQFHTALKIMHSGMQKFKGVSGAMESASKGLKPSSNDLRAVGMLAPNVEFLQVKVVELAKWAGEMASLARGAQAPTEP
mmetsp:Transcript_73342/g.159054  ORF Transcript_73342/g.159054 Transcript_73342/m.159054 type:complete len:242 (+) Transcript_73342:64-789(+)